MKERLSLIALKAIGFLPFKFLYGLARLLAPIALMLPIRENKISKINLKIAFGDKSADWRDKIHKSAMLESTKTLLETPRIWRLSPAEINRLVYEVNGAKMVQAAMDSKKGVLLAVPHIGSWEIMGMWLSLHFVTSSLYRSVDMPKIDEMVKKARIRHGSQLVADNVDGVRQLLKTLKRGEMACILPDHDPGENGSIYVDFFNVAARTSTLLPKLAQRTGVEVFLAYTQRTDSGFILTFKSCSDSIYNKDLYVATRTLNQEIEKIIMQMPEQYIWSYKRYKARPVGAADFY